MKAHSAWAGALTALALVSASAVSFASSHREAPISSTDPSADNTDVWAWVKDGNLIVLASYIPFEEPAGGPNFHSLSDEVLYKIHIARGVADLSEDLVYEVRLSTAKPPTCMPDPDGAVGVPATAGCEFFSQLSGYSQTYSVTKVENGTSTVVVNGAKPAPPNIGPRTNQFAYAIPAGKTYEQFFVDDAATSVVASMTGGGRAFVGPRDDGFYVDLGGIFDLAGLRPQITGSGTPVDNLAGYNTHVIALEIPIDVAKGSAVTAGTPSNDNLVGVWATASRRKLSILRNDGSRDAYGPWVQVSRLGLPLINEAVIGIQDKDKYNRTEPKDDVTNFGGYILNPVVVRDAKFAGFYAMGGPLASFDYNMLKGNRLDVIDVINLKNIPSMAAHDIPLSSSGDVLRVDLGIASGFPNGRVINGGTNTETDVTDVELSLLLTGNPAGPVTDGVSHNDTTYKATFPYLATPWEGFSNGHGKP